MSFIGAVEFFTTTPPAGWLPCDGRLLEIVARQPLYAMISNKYGGDGVTNFALPKMANNLTGAVTGKAFTEAGWCICYSGTVPQRQ